MADRIISLMADPQRARLMGERGHLFARERFSCGQQLRLTEALYNFLLGVSERDHGPDVKPVVGVNVNQGQSR